MKTWRYAQGNDPKTGEGWFVLFVDEAGHVSVQSDFGNYAYCWSAPGEQGIQSFLAKVSDYTLLEKFGQGHKELDLTASLVRAQAAIQAASWLSDEDSHELLERLDDIDDQQELEEWITDAFTLNLDVQEVAVYGRSRQLKAFVREVWPRIKYQVERDLSSALGDSDPTPPIPPPAPHKDRWNYDAEGKACMGDHEKHEPCRYETPPSGMTHIRPHDGRECAYMASVYCNKCGWHSRVGGV